MEIRVVEKVSINNWQKTCLIKIKTYKKVASTSTFFSSHFLYCLIPVDKAGVWAVPQIRIDVIGYLTPYFLINRVKSKLEGFSDCFHSHNLK